MQANQIETEGQDAVKRDSGWLTDRAVWLIAGLIIVAAVVRLLGLSSRAYHPDEWYHLVAGTSWAQGEGLTYVRGIYDRAWPYTISTGLAQNWLGLEGFVAARFPAFLSGVVCVWLIFVLGKRTASSAVGIIAAALLAFDNMAIEWSQHARFYTMQTACILALACVLSGPWIVSLRTSPAKFALAAIGAAAIAVFAILLQVISVLGIAGLGLFLFTRTPYFTIEFARTPSLSRTILAALIALGVVVVLIGGWMVWPELRATQAWTAQDQNNFLYYDDYLRAMYGVLWPLTPLAVLMGFARYRQAVLISLCVIIPVLLVQSLGGMKAPRYVMQATPFLILLWAVGLRCAYLWLTSFARDRLALGSSRPGTWLAGVIVLGAIGFALSANFSLRESVKWTLKDGAAALAGQPLFTGSPIAPDLAAASREVASKLRENTLLIATDPWIQHHFGGTSNLHIINPLNDDDKPFNFQYKTGQVSLGSTAEVEQALQCLDSADIVIQTAKIGTHSLPQETVEVVKKYSQPVPLENDTLRFYRYDRTGMSEGLDCSVLEAELAKQN